MGRLHHKNGLPSTECEADLVEANLIKRMNCIVLKDYTLRWCKCVPLHWPFLRDVSWPIPVSELRHHPLSSFAFCLSLTMAYCFIRMLGFAEIMHTEKRSMLGVFSDICDLVSRGFLLFWS